MRFVVLALILLATQIAAAAEGPLRLDVLLPLTGGSGDFGQSEAQALRVYQGVVNAAGGVHGRPLQFDIHDDQSRSDVAVALVRDLIAQHPAVIMGRTLDATATAIAPLLANGPVFYSFSPGVIPAPRSYLFAASATLESNNISKLAAIHDLGYKRMAVLTETDATGKHNLAFTNEFFASPASRGMQLVASEAYAPDDTGDLAAQVAAIRNAHPDGVTLWANGTAFAVALRALATAGLNLPVFTSQTDANPAQLAALGGALPKMLVVQGLPYQGRVTPAELKAPAAEYLDALKAAGLQPLPSHVYAWDPARIVVSALRALPPNPTADQLRAYLLQLHGFAGLSGVYDFRSGDQHGLTDTTAFPLLRWDAQHQIWLPFDTKPAVTE
jgi:branched-chain amino acid transport system substrate-binding protein